MVGISRSTTSNSTSININRAQVIKYSRAILIRHVIQIEYTAYIFSSIVFHLSISKLVSDNISFGVPIEYLSSSIGLIIKSFCEELTIHTSTTKRFFIFKRLSLVKFRLQNFRCRLSSSSSRSTSIQCKIQSSSILI